MKENHICNIHSSLAALPTNVSFEKMAELYKMFGDPTRLKIMHSLLINKELNVCDIANLLTMTHSAISHQLSTLKKLNLVKAIKKGKEVFYSLADSHVEVIITTGLDHINE